MNMQDKIKQQKLDMWKEKLEALEKEFPIILQKKGEAAAMGDLRENSAFLALEEDVHTFQARINDIKRIIAQLERE